MSQTKTLLSCFQNEDVAGLEHLREMGWDIYEWDKEIERPLTFAIKTHNFKIADWLVCKFHEDGKQGHSQLKFAIDIIFTDHFRIGFFEDCGSDQAVMLKERWKPVLVKCLYDVDKDYLTNCIFYFGTRRCTWMLREVIKAGADVHCLDDDNNTILHCNFDPESYLILLEQGVDINAANDRGFTPLHAALLKSFHIRTPTSRTDKIAMLLVFGADPNLPTRPAFLPVHRETLQRVQMKVHDALERVHDRRVAFCMLTHPRLGNCSAQALSRDILEKCLLLTLDSQRHLILKELGIIDS